MMEKEERKEECKGTRLCKDLRYQNTVYMQDNQSTNKQYICSPNSQEDHKSETTEQLEEHVLEDEKHIVPPNTPAEWNIFPRWFVNKYRAQGNLVSESDPSSFEVENEQLYPTPVDNSPNYNSPAVLSEGDEMAEEGSSVENTRISVHTVPSTALRSLGDMDALLFISSSHTPVSNDYSLNTD